jgi:transcriptional regulator with XRE-family HTH domain
MEKNPSNEKNEGIDAALARRLRERRLALGLTLEALALATDVSRAMISKIERGEASPTAALLSRLAAGLGLSLPALFAADTEEKPLLRRAEQTVWRDPASGYLRRNLADMRADAPLGLVEVELPPGAHVGFDLHPRPHHRQLIYVLEGSLHAVTGDEIHDLEQGDCLSMALDKPNQYRNLTGKTVRYLVAIGAFKGV